MQTTSAEQIPGLTQRWARRTTLLDTMIEAIGLAVAGRAGVRLAAGLGIHVSRDTLLRVVRSIPDQPIETTPILGIDDFAPAPRHVYLTAVAGEDPYECKVSAHSDCLNRLWEGRTATDLDKDVSASPSGELAYLHSPFWEVAIVDQMVCAQCSQSFEFGVTGRGSNHARVHHLRDL